MNWGAKRSVVTQNQEAAKNTATAKKSYAIFSELRRFIGKMEGKNPDTSEVMEAQAIQTLAKILGRRKLDTTVTQLAPGQQTIGSIKVVLMSPGSATNRSVLDNQVETHKPAPLILISPSPPSKLVRERMRKQVRDGIQLFHLKQLQFDIMEHKKYGFPCRILTADEKSALLENLRVTSPMRLPRISFDDPYSLWLGAKPEDVLEFEIPSEAAGWSKKYRQCVLNVEENTEEVPEEANVGEE